jgi:L-asparaginase
MPLYEVGIKVAEAGVIAAGDKNTETIVAKLMWIFANTSEPAEI